MWQDALQNFSAESKLGNVAISASVKSRHWDVALCVLGSMLYQAIHDVFGFNCIISSSQWHRATFLLYSMAGLRLSPDTISHNSAIGVSKSWSTACALQLAMTQSVSSDLFSFNTLMSSYASAGHWIESLQLLASLAIRSLLADAVSYNAALASCAWQSLWRSATSLMHRSHVDHVADPVTTNTVIAACAAAARWRNSLAFASHGCDVPVDIVGLTAALSACGGDQWDLALQMLSSMPEKRVRMNTITVNAVINACGDRWQLALLLFERMQSLEVLPSMLTYSSVISSCEKGRQWQLALHFLEIMSRRSKRPSEITVNATISACERISMWQKALDLLHVSLQSWQLQPTVVSYSSTISACSKSIQWQFAVQLLSTLTSTRLSILRDSDAECDAAFASTLTACQASGRWQLMLGLLEMMARPTALCLATAVETCEKGGVFLATTELLDQLFVLKHPWALLKDVERILESISSADSAVASGLVTALKRHGVEARLQRLAEVGAVASDGMALRHALPSLRESAQRLTQLETWKVAELSENPAVAELVGRLSEPGTLDDIGALLQSQACTPYELSLHALPSRLLPLLSSTCEWPWPPSADFSTPTLEAYMLMVP
eukprot:symbB.v1.2.017677.t1/scaffold1368.1/size123082/4